MSGLTRPVRDDEVARLWPAVQSSRLMAGEHELAAFREAAPWRVRVSERGDAVLLAGWRDHLDVLAIRGLWAPDERIGALIDDVCAVAREHGYGRVMSPLLAENTCAPYLAVGMHGLGRLVAFTASARGVRGGSPATRRRVDAARTSDAHDLEAVDRASFDAFWRHSAAEFVLSIADEHVRVVRDDAGVVMAYAASGLCGSVVTVSRLAVSPPLRRTGVASALLLEAAEWAVQCGALGLSLCTQEENAAARALYSARGFSEAPDLYELLIRTA